VGSIVVSTHFKPDNVALHPFLFVNNSNWQPSLTHFGYPSREVLCNDFGEVASLFHYRSHGFQGNYVGLQHYRRAFTNSPEVRYTKHIPKLDFSDELFIRKQQITDEDWELRLKRFDIVLSAKQSVKTFGISSLYEHFTKFHKGQQVEYADSIISALDHKLPSFTDYLKNRNSMSFYNMNVSRMEVGVELSDFLEAILLPMTKELHPGSEYYQPRWAGYLSERLLDYWVETRNEKSKLTVGYLGTLIADKPDSKWVPRWAKDNGYVRKIHLGLKR
jgi:hypothetical protein